MKTKKPTLNDLIGKPIRRDEAYIMRVFDKALIETVKKDVVVEFGDYSDLCRRYPYWAKGGPVVPSSPGRKVKAYCRAVNSYLQFPRELRKPDHRCICDIVSTENDKVGGFWRVIKGTIRKDGSDKVIG